MFRDLRYSLRSLLKRPGFTVVVVATLALGIGVNAAIFSVFNILLRPLQVKEPESIVRLTWESTRRADQFSFPYYSYIRNHNQSFSDVIAVYEEERFLLGENRPNSDPEEILGNFVSENYFAMLGGTTHLGRTFTAEENSVPGRDAVIVLSYRFWRAGLGVMQSLLVAA
jgi:putative ABC transport system permease protein